jgi:glycosyltransferase involved in cell wall biosynthesis
VTSQPHCVLVTTFAQGQPGFLDFSYRIKALAAHYRLTVVSGFALEQAELQYPGVEYVVLPCGQGRADWLRYLWRCAALVRARRPAVAVLLHSMAAPVANLLGRIPSVTYWNEHPTHVAPAPAGAAPLKRALRAAVRWLMFRGARQSTLVLPIGEAHRDDLLAHGCRPQRMELQYMGVDQRFANVALAPHGGDPDLVQLIYVGSVQAERGRDVMLEAMALAHADGVRKAHLTIVGASDEQLAYCRAAVARLGVADAVTLQGRVPGLQVPGYFARADAGLCLWEDLPWYRFNPPTKLFEYLVAGLPVLASDIRTHTEYIRDGHNGLVFDYSAAGLAQAIARLWQQRAGLADLKQRARASSDAYLWPAIEPAFLHSVQKVTR